MATKASAWDKADKVVTSQQQLQTDLQQAKQSLRMAEQKREVAVAGTCKVHRNARYGWHCRGTSVDMHSAAIGWATAGCGSLSCSVPVSKHCWQQYEEPVAGAEDCNVWLLVQMDQVFHSCCNVAQNFSSVGRPVCSSGA